MYLGQFKRYSSTLLNQCILGVMTLDFALSRSLNFDVTLMCSHKCLVRISERYLYYLWKYKMLKVLKNDIYIIMLYNGIFACHGNICYAICSNAIFARYIV